MTTSSHPRGSFGHVFDAMRKHGVSEDIIQRLNFKEGGVIVNEDTEKVFASFKYFDGMEDPLFYFQEGKYMKQGYIVQEDGTKKPDFKLKMYVHNSPALVFHDRDAAPELHDFIREEMMTSWTDEPGYTLTNESGAFFQGGSESRDGGFIYIEFWKPAGAQAFVDYINENYKPK